jgi:hypothetical protein
MLSMQTERAPLYNRSRKTDFMKPALFIYSFTKDTLREYCKYNSIVASVRWRPASRIYPISKPNISPIGHHNKKEAAHPFRFPFVPIRDRKSSKIRFCTVYYAPDPYAESGRTKGYKIDLQSEFSIGKTRMRGFHPHLHHFRFRKMAFRRRFTLDIKDR